MNQLPYFVVPAASASSSTYTATTAWQKAAIAAVSAMGALANPARADLVAALGETTGAMAYQRMRQRMQVDPEGRVRTLSFRFVFHGGLDIFLDYLLQI